MGKCVLKTVFLFTLSTALMLAVPCCRAQNASPDDALAHAKLTYSQQGAKAALPEFEQALESYRKAGDRRGEAITTGLIGNCYKHLGDYSRAEAMLNSALQMKRELHDRPEEGKTLSHLGLVYWEQGQYSKAIEEFNCSISIAREIGDARLEAASLNNLSLVYDEQGDYRRSLVLASLWKVSDRSTLIIMRGVYRRIRREGGATALAKAQRAMIRSQYYSSPYHWAPFVFVWEEFGAGKHFCGKELGSSV